MEFHKSSKRASVHIHTRVPTDWQWTGTGHMMKCELWKCPFGNWGNHFLFFQRNRLTIFPLGQLLFFIILSTSPRSGDFSICCHRSRRRVPASGTWVYSRTADNSIVTNLSLCLVNHACNGKRGRNGAFSCRTTHGRRVLALYLAPRDIQSVIKLIIIMDREGDVGRLLCFDLSICWQTDQPLIQLADICTCMRSHLYGIGSRCYSVLYLMDI